MNKKLTIVLKASAVVLIGMAVVIFLSVNKISASVALLAAAIMILLSIRSIKLKRGRIVFVVIMFLFVLSNIATVELPPGHQDETGFIFFDKVLHIYKGFLNNAFGISVNPDLSSTTAVPASE